MNEAEIEEKLERLKEYEAQERKAKRWEPFREMDAYLTYMRQCKNKLQEAAFHQDDVEEVSREFGLDLQTYGRACIWSAHEDLEKQITAKEKELMELEDRLTEEE